MAQIICDNLTLGYENTQLLTGLSFQVNAGDYLCIVGENGSGKSTLVRTLLGLQPPVSGTIRFSDGLLAKEIGYLPQQTEVQGDFPASVREIVLSGCQSRMGLRPFYQREERALAEKTKELALPCVLVIDGSDQKLARAVVQSAGVQDCELLCLDSMQSTRSTDGKTYLSVMEDNLAVLNTALN